MQENSFIGYEYQEVSVKRSMVSVYADGYSNFGWQIDGTAEQPGKMDSISMKFKRDRKIRNKAELTRLQRNFDSCVSEILTLESSKYIMASVAAYAVGIIGTALWQAPCFPLLPICSFHALSLLFPLLLAGCFPISSTGALWRKKHLRSHH